MTEVFHLPDLGEGLPEAEIVQWLVAEGDDVTLNQTLAEVETAKAVVELPSPFAGTVSALHAGAGDVVAVGSALISIDSSSPNDAPTQGADPHEAEPGEATAGGEQGDDDGDAAPGPNLVGYGAVARSVERPRRRPRATRSPAAGAGDTAVLEAAPHDDIDHSSLDDQALERPRSTPPVRALARRLGVDLALVAATGATDLITREDVEAYADRVGLESPRPSSRGSVGVEDGGTRAHDSGSHAPDEGAGRPRELRTPIRGVRKHTAAAMVASAFTAPHVTTFLTVDVTASMALIESLRADRALEGRRIGIMALAAKACVLALGRHPSLNSHWDEDAGEIVQYGYVNLGIAAATERGLVVPHIRDADQLTLVELSERISALAETARGGKTAPEDMRGGTFSITNVGVFGVDAGTPILNPGEAGILALGAVRKLPWEHRGEIALRDVTTLALSFDHRLVDGEQGARFLAEVGAVLEEPGRAMLLR